MADKLRQIRNGGSPQPTTVSSQRSISGTSLSCVALTDWPTATDIDFITFKKTSDGDVDETTLCVWTGKVSGTTIGSLDLQSGTDDGNDVGDFVEMAPTDAWAEGIYDWGATEHNTDGTHSAVTADSITTDTLGVTSSITLPNGAIAPSKLAIHIKVGSFSAPVATGHFSVTGIGFKPQAVRFIFLSSASNTDAVSSVGVMDGAGNQFVYGTHSASNNWHTYSSTSNCLAFVPFNSDVPTTLASYVSMDADGFTINFSVITGGGIFGWEAIA